MAFTFCNHCVSIVSTKHPTCPCGRSLPDPAPVATKSSIHRRFFKVMSLVLLTTASIALRRLQH